MSDVYDREDIRKFTEKTRKRLREVEGEWSRSDVTHQQVRLGEVNTIRAALVDELQTVKRSADGQGLRDVLDLADALLAHMRVSLA